MMMMTMMMIILTCLSCFLSFPRITEAAMDEKLNIYRGEIPPFEAYFPLEIKQGL